MRGGGEWPLKLTNDTTLSCLGRAGCIMNQSAYVSARIHFQFQSESMGKSLVPGLAYLPLVAPQEQGQGQNSI